MQSLRHSGMVNMQLTNPGRFELYRHESVGRRAFSVSLLSGSSAFGSRILHQKVQSAREEECGNSYMWSTVTRPCTLYILAQLPSVHSLDQL